MHESNDERAEDGGKHVDKLDDILEYIDMYVSQRVLEVSNGHEVQFRCDG